MKKALYISLVLLMLLAIYQTTTTITAQPDCGAGDFLDVQPDPANSAYADPELTASCTATDLVVTSNGIPNYEFVPITPGNLRERENTWTIPLTPIGDQESIPLLGDVAVLVNGIPIYGPNEGGNLGYGDPYLDDVLDFCSGHIGPSGYHNHAPPLCIFDDFVENIGLVVGYSLDGWPILAPYECGDAACTTIVELQSSWQLTNPNVTAAWDKHTYIEGAGDLDECNGKVQPDGSYAYYATSTFPYFLGCYVNAEYSIPTAVSTTQPSTEQLHSYALESGIAALLVLFTFVIVRREVS